jgi:hypothetical protein
MLAFVMVLIFLLGFPFEWIEICLIVLPIFGPILMKYGFSEHLGDQRYMMAWFGTLVAVNLQAAFMTPPFGATLFYMKGTAPLGVTMTDVCRGMYPFVALQLVRLLLCIYFPSIVLWLPGLAGVLDSAPSGGRDELPTSASPARDHVALSYKRRKTCRLPERLEVDSQERIEPDRSVPPRMPAVPFRGGAAFTTMLTRPPCGLL